MEQIIGVGIFFVLLSILGLSASSFFKGDSLPKWAKFNPAYPWGHPWIDGKRWLKKILISIVQGIILVFVFCGRAVITLTKAMFKFMDSPVKK